MALCLFRRVARASSAALRLQQVSRQNEVCAPSAMAEPGCRFLPEHEANNYSFVCFTTLCFSLYFCLFFYNI